ncbi:MAG: ubiquinol-cytochrome c reductase cytochrome c1 subunit [Lysobacterales bacterium]|jgi:ubiquinol-cytochrome c reductase cytochrome c1 subunit
MRLSALKTFLPGILMVLVSTSIMASSENHIEPSGVNINDTAALQRGAGLFVNYCLSCHSASYMRYSRLAQDLDLSEEVVMENLVFSDAKIGDTMEIAMQAEDAERWFSNAPPDLSLVGRSRGPDWLYAYLRSFYEDESGKWNNHVLPNVAMPHVLWQVQENLSPEEYDNTVRDLVTFLDYLGEPAKLKRKNIGVWVILFLAVFAFLTYLLKAEYWRDVH